MAYSTEVAVRAATGITDASKVTSATVVARIAYADSIINSKIGSVYTLPLSASCDIIVFLSLEIASLMVLLDNYGEETEEVDKGWSKRLKMAMGILEDIQEMKMQLFDTAGAELTRNTIRQPAGFPTDASSDPTATNSTEPQLTMSQQF